MDKRYQVFVSSTFDDLREQRSAVISTLLEMDCFPTGMELFPASDDDSWTLIKSVIDDSDYYLVIVAGRYGSLHPTARKSYTHLEYDYALSTGKPIIALLHSNPDKLPAKKTERTDQGRRQLEEFYSILKAKNCRFWADRADLVTAVFTGIQHLRKTRPGVGWVTGSTVPDEAMKDELLRLRREIDSLNRQLVESQALAVTAPEGIDDLAQGDEEIAVTITFGASATVPCQQITLCWTDILRSVLPNALGGGAGVATIENAICGLAHEMAVKRDCPWSGDPAWRSPSLSRSDYGKVVNQMCALGLIQAVSDPNTPRETIWKATPYGAQVGCRLLAYRKEGVWW